MGTIIKHRRSKWKSPKMASRAIMGPEPAKQGAQFVPDRVNLINAYSWYAEQYEVPKVRHWVIDWMRSSDAFSDEDTKAYEASKDMHTSMTMCAVARMLMLGCPLSKVELDYLTTRIREVIASNAKEDDPVHVAVKPRRSSNVIATIESELDKFYADYKFFKPDVYNLLKKAEAKPSDANTVIKFYEPLYEEVKEAGEGYERLRRSKKKREAYVQFVEAILEDAKLYVRNERTTSVKPRKVRKVREASQVKKIKFATEDANLKLVSADPSTIINATVVYTYNPKYKLLTQLLAEKGKAFSIKGTTIQNVDEKLSGSKSVKSPNEYMPAFVMGNKASMGREYTELKSTARKATGRINENIIILKAYK